MEGSGIGQFIPLILIFVIFYFFLIRPQQKKVKEHKAMVEGLKRGDKVITSGGITGTVERLIDNGALIIGKTNTPEWGLGSQTFNRLFGATANPYDISKTPGGSSG